MSGFLQALPFVLRMEGGFVDDPDDRGGATNFGITQNTLDVWNGSRSQPKRSVREITKAEVEAIYHEQYWVAGKCDALPWPVSAAHFDAWIQHRPDVAAKMLQEAVGAIPDGMIGPNTIAAVNAADPRELLEDLYWIRLDFYYRISKGSQLKFLRGWLRRMIHLREELRP